MNNLKFLTGICLTAQLLLLSACSSDEPAPTNVEFRSSASTLNGHLRNLLIPDSDSSNNYFKVNARENPEEDLWVFAMKDVMEIPAKGGTYDFVNPDTQLLSLRIYEDMPLLSHKKSDYSSYVENYGVYENPYGEYEAYNELISKRKSPDAEISFRDKGKTDPAVTGAFGQDDYSKAVDSFSYTFPENHTGKYRLFVLSHNNSWEYFPTGIPTYGRSDYTTYFIQMPD